MTADATPAPSGGAGAQRFAPGTPARVVVLLSGSGTLCQALLDATTNPRYGVRVVAVGSDRPDVEGLARARRARIDTFVEPLAAHPDRAAWDEALTAVVDAHAPDLVVLAGFMRLVGPAFLERFAGRCLNSHPALSPAFPGAHAVRDALAYGVHVTGTTLFLVDAGVDTGAIVAQQPVPVRPDDDEPALHERIKTYERSMLVDVVGRMSRDGWTVRGRKVTIP